MSSNAHYVLILGCGRSGTSIFGELFEHLPDYVYYSEPDFDALAELDYAQPVAIKVPRESKSIPSDKGLSFSLDMLLNIIPQPLNIYWQIRHPLDTIASLKVGINKNWGHHPRPHDWQDWLKEPLVKRCAYHWTYINTFGYNQVADHVKISRFEDMLLDAQGFAHTICEEVGLNLEKSHPAILSWASRVQNKNNDKFLEAKTSRPYSTRDHSVKINRWKENLSTEDLEQVIPMIEELTNQFGYTLPLI